MMMSDITLINVFLPLLTGGGTLIPKEGAIVDGKCVTTGNLTAEQVTLQLQVRNDLLFLQLLFDVSMNKFTSLDFIIDVFSRSHVLCARDNKLLGLFC